MRRSNTGPADHPIQHDMYMLSSLPQHSCSRSDATPHIGPSSRGVQVSPHRAKAVVALRKAPPLRSKPRFSWRNDAQQAISQSMTRSRRAASCAASTTTSSRGDEDATRPSACLQDEKDTHTPSRGTRSTLEGVGTPGTADQIPGARSLARSATSTVAQDRPGIHGRGSSPYLYSGTPTKFYPRWAKPRRHGTPSPANVRGGGGGGGGVGARTSPVHVATVVAPGHRSAPHNPRAAQRPSQRALAHSHSVYAQSSMAPRRAHGTPSGGSGGFGGFGVPAFAMRQAPRHQPPADHRTFTAGQYLEMGPNGLGCERWTGCGPTRSRAPPLSIWADAIEEGASMVASHGANELATPTAAQFPSPTCTRRE